MSDLLFIRHAATDLAGTFCGHTDPPINEEGTRQVAALLEQFDTHRIDRIYSSDLRRACATALLLARNDATIIEPSPALREIYFGDWEDLTWAGIEQRDPVFAAQWLAQYPNLPAPQGEQYQDFCQRVLNEITRIEQTTPNQRVAIVTHAGVMREVLRHRCGQTSQQAWEQTRDYCCTFTLARRA